MKKDIWEASDEEIDRILSDYEIPSPPEWTKEGTYIQNTIRYKIPQLRKKNDIVFIDTPFTHTDEAKTSLGLLLFPEMVDMGHAVNTDPEFFIPGEHMDTATDFWGKSSKWSESEGHVGIELACMPVGMVGHARKADPKKAKKAVAAIFKYLTLVNDEILESLPAGTVPPVEKVTLRTGQEMAPYLKEPLSKGWKSI